MVVLGECSNSSSNSHSFDFWVTPSTPPPPRPSPLSPTSPPQLTKDACFSCKRVGHWARECPNKTPKRAHPSTAGSSSSSPSPPMESCHLPVIRCPCGGGACRVHTSNTDKNQNRKFYACPLGRSGNCNYFRWCDEVAKHQVPPCPCGAGISSLNRELSGPNVGRWYFACRIKKNHGACRFYCLVDFELDALLNKHLDRIRGSSSPRCLSTDQHTLNTMDYDLNEEEHFNSGIKFKSSENLSNLTIPQNFLHLDKVGVPHQDLVMKEAGSSVSVMEKAHHSCKLISQSKICRRQKQYLSRISAAGNSLAEEFIFQVLGVKFHGWLGRLVFPPAHSLKDPPVLSIFWCVFPSFYPIPTTEEENLANAEDLPDSVVVLEDNSDVRVDLLWQQTHEQNDERLSSILCEPAGVENLSTAVQTNAFSGMVLKKMGYGLVSLLESMEVSDHEKMLEVAEATFESWQQMGVECGPFSEAVKGYILCASRLANVKAGTCKDLSSTEAIDSYYREKAHFDNVSRIHQEAASAFEVSNGRLQSLQEEASCIKDILVRLEKEISYCEGKTLELQNSEAEWYHNKVEAEKRMEAASIAMEMVLEQEQQVEAANAAMEKLKAWIQE